MSLHEDHDALEVEIRQLLAHPDYVGHPLAQALERLWQQYQTQLGRLERVVRLSDRYQTMLQAHDTSLSQRFQRQLRQLEKMARISDRYQQMMQDLNAALHQASTHDTLTQLPNRRMLGERLRDETERSMRLQRPFSVAMLDLDHFKSVNDRYGHDVGDTVLIHTAQTMLGSLREYDLCARWGGEEFLLLLPDTDLDEALQVAERLRETIAHSPVPIGEVQSVTVTLSLGLTAFVPGDTSDALLHRADEALLAAKRLGRNRCQVG